MATADELASDPLPEMEERTAAPLAQVAASSPRAAGASPVDANDDVELSGEVQPVRNLPRYACNGCGSPDHHRKDCPFVDTVCNNC